MGIIQTIRVWLGFEEPVKPDSATTRLQKIIDQQTERLAAGRSTLQRSADLVSRFQRERNQLQLDVNTLRLRVEHRAFGDVPQATFQKKLTLKQEEFTNKQYELDRAAKDHNDNLAMIEEYNQSINRARIEAQRDAIQLDLAQADNEAAKFQADLRHGLSENSAATAREEVQQAILRAKAEASVNRSISGEDKQEQNDEYLKAAEQAEKKE